MEVDHKLGSIDRVIIFDASESAIYSPLSPTHRVYKVCPASSNGLLPWPSCARSVSDPRVLTLTPFYRKSHFHDRRSIHASRSRKKGVKIARSATRASSIRVNRWRCGEFLDPFLLEYFSKFWNSCYFPIFRYRKNWKFKSCFNKRSWSILFKKKKKKDWLTSLKNRVQMDLKILIDIEFSIKHPIYV